MSPFHPDTMNYTITITTSDHDDAGTYDYLYATLIGEHGESERTLLDNFGKDFERGSVSFSPLLIIIFISNMTGLE